jgi:signal transduction histidine kinase
MNAWRRLYAHYHAYHAIGRPRLKYIGCVAAAATALFYFIRFTRPDAPLFDDLPLRLLAFLAFLALALKDQWPAKLQPHYIGFSWFALLLALPFYTVLTALQRGGGMPSVSNIFIMLFFLVLLADWRNVLVILALGTGLAFGVYFATAANPSVPPDLVAQLPAYALILLGGNLFKFTTDQAEAERRLAEERAANERRVNALREAVGFLAHELNTPLATVRGCVAFVAERLEAPQPASAFAPPMEDRPGELVDALRRAERRALYCQSVVSTFAQSARAAFPDAASEPLPASELVDTLLQQFPLEAHERPIVQPELRQDFLLPGRRDLLYLVLCTVLKNALLALRGRPDAALTIEIDMERRGEAAQGCIRFVDNGPGIAPEVLAKLTHEPVTTRAHEGGTGMGLMFCQRVMGSMQGAIEVQSTLGLGTTVTLRFRPAAGRS